MMVIRKSSEHARSAQHDWQCGVYCTNPRQGLEEFRMLSSDGGRLLKSQVKVLNGFALL